MSGPNSRAERAINHVMSVSDGSGLDRSLRVTVNFHPDRESSGVSVMESLARQRLYRSQFETHTSNGGLGTTPGSPRWNWEHQWINGAYDTAAPAEHPKYGALNHRRRPLGGSPRFGSAYLRLTESMLDRCTFCFPDSYFAPTHFGTSTRFNLLRLADALDSVPRDDQIEQHAGGWLDDYIEAHIHGPIRLLHAVEAIVLDPSHEGTPVETFARRSGAPVEWHEGRVLTLDDLARHPDFRGPEPIALGLRIAQGNRLDARIIGDAARTGEHDPQLLKKLWHLTARHGRPAH